MTSDIRGKSIWLGKNGIGCHHADGAVNNQARRATWCKDHSKLAYGSFGIHLFELWNGPLGRVR